MATAVYTTEEVTLQDDTTVTLKPLNISGLRKFMKRMDAFTSAESEDDGFEALLAAAALCLSKQRPEFWDEKFDNGKTAEGAEKPKGKHTEAFEEAADMPTVYKILDVCGGVQLNDPNLLAAAAGALGTTST